jgi:23S rRNA (guanine745-N1)-methyltransferase
MLSILQCPVCRESLVPSVSGYQCPNEHTFDAAKQGYVNLLLSHRKHSKEPGDSPEMIQSRRRFLNRGFYDPLSSGINQVLKSVISGLENQTRLEGLEPISILDAGCGEGFYTENLKVLLSQQASPKSNYQCYGVDIAKYAIRQATQRDKAIGWLVASIIDLPFAKASVDLAFSIFAPINFEEFSRILKPRGRLVLVTPGANHLKSLREVIYAVVRERQPSIFEQNQAFFTLESITNVAYQTELENQEDIMNLLAMTPYFWNIDLTIKSKIAALSRLPLEVDVSVSVLKHFTG